MFRNRISWRSILAGVVTTFAVSIIMAVFGVALGFTVINPLSDQPFAGLGTAFSLWSVLSVIVSLAAGGFMAGYVGGRSGIEHGFLTWATVLIVSSYVGGQAIGTAVDGVGAVVHDVGATAVNVATSVGGGLADAAGEAADSIQERLAGVDAGTARENVAAVLRDTGVPYLQPEYVRAQMRDFDSDLRLTINQINLNAEDYGAIIAGFVDKQRDRLQNISGDVDREAVVTALMNNRGLQRQEAEQTADTALAAYSGAVRQAQGVLQEAELRFTEAREYLDSAAAQARIRADEFASTAARTALLAGLSLIAGAIVAGLAGRYGRERSRRYHGEGVVETVTTTGILQDVI